MVSCCAENSCPSSSHGSFGISWATLRNDCWEGYPRIPFSYIPSLKQADLCLFHKWRLNNWTSFFQFWTSLSCSYWVIKCKIIDNKIIYIVYANILYKEQTIKIIIQNTNIMRTTKMHTIAYSLIYTYLNLL